MTKQQNTITEMAERAKKAAHELTLISTAAKNTALKNMSKALLKNQDFIIRENQKDLKEAKKKNYNSALVTRLIVDEKMVKEMAEGLIETSKLKDPVGEVLSKFKRPNGLEIEKVRVPIGVIGIVFESRPNVTSDCIGLCLKSGNAAILKGGREAFYSNQAIFKVLHDELQKSDISKDAIYLISSTDREAFQHLLKLEQYVDLIVPRGGEELIRFVTDNTKIPVIKHYKGVCHTYVSEFADINMAHDICLNAKVQKPGVCNAMETMLIHHDIAVRFLPIIAQDFKTAGVEIRGCPVTRKILKNSVKAATEEDWSQEYLDLILSVKVVENSQEAIKHINHYGSHHSDAIVTEDRKEAERFLKAVDSACLYVNASTRFTDGFQFGFGAEIGISTDKLHARGPMALEELTTYKYLVRGTGQIRQ